MKGCGCCENIPCGCCEGVEPLTPQSTANHPGLNALFYRVGTHSTFFETMQARLSNFYLENSGFDKEGKPETTKTYPLKDLRTRSRDDMSIALLDAAATMLDVLTFYQERIANEGYLRTATERRSVLEMARLVGYTPRPGVSASVYLAYTMDEKSEPVKIPVGARAQSVPAQGELPQSFETSEKLEARKEWNDLKPRASRPQKITQENIEVIDTIYFEGTETNLKPNDLLLFVLGERRILHRVETVEPLFDVKKTKITLQRSSEATHFKILDELIERYANNSKTFCIDELDELKSAALTLLDNMRIVPTGISKEQIIFINFNYLQNLKIKAEKSGNTPVRKWLSELVDELVKKFGMPNTPSVSAFTGLVNLINPLSLPASKQPANRLLLEREPKKVFAADQDTLPQILTAFNKDILKTAYTAWANSTVTNPSPLKVYAFRVTAQLFGNSAPIRFQINQRGIIEKTNEPPIVEEIWVDNTGGADVVSFQQPKTKIFKHEKETIIYLDTTYEKILPDSWVIVDKRAVDTTGFENFDLTSADAPKNLIITQAAKVFPPVTRSDYDISGKTTRLDLKQTWIKFKDKDLHNSPDAEFRLVRQTVVYAQSEQLELAAESINDDMCGNRIELGALYEGLRAGRWIIVSGERTDIPNTSGIRASELVMLAGIEQSYDANLPGDTIHSTLILANSLAYTYKRETVRIYGNVVKATHGEMRAEVLGSGDATQSTQAFTLKQPPLTYVSAPTPSGIKSTLQVRVNDIEWDETDTLAELKPQDRNFITKTDDEAKTTVIFGNGEQGARPPTGVENITAVYRNGIGKGGNVKSEQISLLVTKPLGVTEVINPLRASGGADKETRDQARRNAPLALVALDRLVSTSDYGYFARTFAGIGKAYATRLTDGRRRLVHLTLAGAEDIPIDINSDLCNNLRRALSKYGDAFQPVQIEMREFLALIIIARVRIHAKYLWESVEPKIRAAMVDAFSFERRELGQNVYMSEVISVIQRVEGVVYVDVDMLEGVSETEIKDENFIKETMAFWLNPELKKKAQAGARAVADAAEGATAAAAATAARDKANTFTTEPERKFADMVAKAAEAAVTKAGSTANSVKAAAFEESDKITLQIDKSTLIKRCVSAKLARVKEDTETKQKKILPAQLAYLLSDVPDTLVLSKIDEVEK
jgi:predicted phage baseplate assembly protein